MTTIAEYTAGIAKATINMMRFNRIVNGAVDELVPVDDGSVRTLRGIQKYGSPGPTGASNNTYTSRGDAANSPIAQRSLILAAPKDTGLFTWQEGDYSASQEDIIVSTKAPITQGAWVYSEKAPDPVTGFFGMSFRGDNDLQYPDLWYGKPTGETFLRLNSDPFDNPGEVRDPALFKGDDGYWYYFRTIGFSSASFEIRRSMQKNLVSGFQHWQTVDCSAGGTIRLAWAPSPFRNPLTGKWYAEVALGPTSDPTTHYMAVVEFTASDFSSWKAAVTMGMGINYIDGSTIFSRGNFYHVAKHEETQPAGKFKYVEIWKASSYPTGPWTKITNGDFLAIPYDVEGPNPVESDDGVCHIFLDANANGLFYHVSAPSFEGPWSTPKSVDKGGLPLRHGFFFNIDDSNRADVQQALDFYGVDLGGSGEAKYLLQGAEQKGQAVSVESDGTLIGAAMAWLRAPGNWNVFRARGGPSPFSAGFDLLMAGAGATYGVAVDAQGVMRNAWKVVWATGYFDAPNEFEPRDLTNLTLQNGWTSLNNLPLKAYRDRMGRVMLTGLIDKSGGTPSEGEVIANLGGGLAPARVEMFPCTSGDGKGTTPIANLAVVNGTLIWISGGKTKIYVSPVQFIGINSVTNT